MMAIDSKMVSLYRQASFFECTAINLQATARPGAAGSSYGRWFGRWKVISRIIFVFMDIEGAWRCICNILA